MYSITVLLNSDREKRKLMLILVWKFFFLKVYIGLDFDIIFTSLMVSSLAAITEDFIQESYLIHIVVGISVLNISFDISYDGTSVEEKI